MENQRLFLSMHLPNTAIPEAGQKLAALRLEKFIKVNSENSELITLVNSREKNFLKDSDFKNINSVFTLQITNFRRLINLLQHINIPFDIALKTDERIKKIIKNNNYEDIHIEYEQGIANIPIYYQSRCNLVLHDVLSQSLLRFYLGEKNKLKKFIYYLRYKHLLHWEIKTFKKLKKITVLNKKDEVIVKKILGDNYVDVTIDYPKVSEQFEHIIRNSVISGSILFWGAMNRKENIDAVFWFVKTIFPKIVNKIPSAHLYIVGANPIKEIEALKSDNVTVTGFVESPIEFFEMASLAIAPLRFGAGIKLKVLETITAKIPTIATDVGGEGIDDINGVLYIENDPDKFAEKAIEILSQRG